MNRKNKQANKQGENRYKDEPGTTQNEGQEEENTAEEEPPGLTVGHKILVLIGVLVGMTSTFAYFVVTRAPRLPELDLEEYWGLPNEEYDESIRPFTIEFSDAMVDDLKTRLLHHKAPPNPLDHSGSTYGFNAHFLAEVVDYWRNKYDFKKQEQYLNQFEQFKTKIQGLDIHFIHSKPKESDLDVMPILLLHGWPGSVREFYEVIPILTDIVDKKDKNIVFEVVVPSLPGFGFSQGASRPGFGPLEMAIVLNNLMGRLGIPKYYLHGTDVGHTIGSIMATVFPENVLGFHTNNPMIAFNPVANIYVTLGSLFPFFIEKKELQNRMYPLSEKIAFYMEETGYMHIQATKPDTIGAALSDTPAGLAAYILEKFATWTHPDNKKAYDGNLTLYFPLISLLDNIMIYWATNSITTSMRVYAESLNSRNMLTIFDSIPTKVPVCGIKFRHELIYQPDSIVRIKYHNLLQTVLISVGGHFPAMELPTILARNIFDSVYLMQLFHKHHKDKIKPVRAPESVYDFTVKDIRGMDVRLSKYRGHVLLIVNVASQCGLTDTNYQELNQLHEKYYDQGLRILAFPCNQFYSQEPGTPQEILQFTKQKGVKFDIFAKVEVNGDNTHPLWAFLKEKRTGTLGNFIKWNFSKFLVDREGNPVKRFGPEKDPLKIEPFLVQYL